MRDIFGNEIQLKEIKLTLFADERKNVKNRWDYLCLFNVPSDRISDALDKLDKSRIVDKWHGGKKERYNRELKFSGISKISWRWENERN